MSAERWVGFAGEKERPDVERAAQAVGARRVEFAASADELRRGVFESAPSECSVIVGPSPDGVSDVNLAAALANDGNARRVVLARWGVSGSLRSRAARAGIDLVIDLGDLGGGDHVGEAKTAGDDGGRRDGLRPGPPGWPGEGDGTPGVRALAPEPGTESEPGPGLAPVVTLCSGRGGVGKTALVAMMAETATSWGMRVVALDLDLSCGNLHSCLGLAHGLDLARVATSGETVASLLEDAPSAAPGLRVLGPCERPEMAELAMPHVGRLIDAARADADLVLVDTSTTFTDAVAQAAQLSDRLVLVSDEMPGAAAALARLGGLAVRLGVARTRIARLENRADPRSKADFSIARAEVGLEAARAFRVFFGGAEVCELLAAGQAGELVGSGSPFAESAGVVLAQVLAELGCLPDCEEAQRASQGSTTRRWRGLFGRRGEARRA